MAITRKVEIGADDEITIHRPIAEAVQTQEAAPAPDKELTPEELQQMSAAAVDSLFGTKPKTKPKTAPEPTDEEKAKQAADAKAAEEAEQKKKQDEAAAAAAKKPVKVTPSKPVPPTADEIADKVAQKLQPEAAPKAKAELESLSADDLQRREVLAEMARSDPDEYGDHVKKFDKFIVAENEYKKKWAKANPDAEFKPEDDAHKEFYDANQPTFVEDDYDNARIRVEARKIANETIAEQEYKRNYEKAREQVIEKLKTVEQEAIKDLAIQIDPDLAKLKDLGEEDPIAAMAITPHIREIAEQSAELMKAFTPDLNYRFDISNPVHVKIMDATHRFELELLAEPKDQQRASDGRMMAEIKDYHRMSPDERRKHWTIWMEPKAVRALLIRDAGKKAKAQYEKLKGFIAKSANPLAEKTTPNQIPATVTAAAPETDKKKFPNTAGSAETVAPSGTAIVFTAQDAKTIGDVLFSS